VKSDGKVQLPMDRNGTYTEIIFYSWVVFFRTRRWFFKACVFFITRGWPIMCSVCYINYDLCWLLSFTSQLSHLFMEYWLWTCVYYVVLIEIIILMCLLYVYWKTWNSTVQVQVQKFTHMYVYEILPTSFVLPDKHLLCPPRIRPIVIPINDAHNKYVKL
jgi:hypothetical protein